MSTTAVHPLELRIGQFIRFNTRPRTLAPAHGPDRSGRIAAKSVNCVLVEHGLTLAGTKVLLIVPHEHITGVWLGPPQMAARTLVPVRRELRHEHRRSGGLLARIFRDTPAPVVLSDGAYSLDDISAPWAS